MEVNHLVAGRLGEARAGRIAPPEPPTQEEATVQQWDLRTLDVRAHRPEVLETSDEGRTILLLLPAGESLQEHQVHERAWLLVVDGEVEIEQDDRVTEAAPGTLAVFEPKEPHEVRARSDARLLLVLAPWPGEGHPSQHAGRASS